MDRRADVRLVGSVSAVIEGLRDDAQEQRGVDLHRDDAPDVSVAVFKQEPGRRSIAQTAETQRLLVSRRPVSTNAGSSYIGPSLNAVKLVAGVSPSTPTYMGTSGGGRTTQLVGTLSQPTTGGTAAFVFNGGDEASVTIVGNARYSTSAAIDHVRITAPSGSLSTGRIILQPKSKR